MLTVGSKKLPVEPPLRRPALELSTLLVSQLWISFLLPVTAPCQMHSKVLSRYPPHVTVGAPGWVSMGLHLLAGA